MPSEIYTKNDLLTKIKQGQNIQIYKQPLSNNYQRFGKIIDIWTANGNPPAGGTFTSNGSILNKQTTGALQFRSAAEGKNLYLADVNFYSSWKNVADNNGSFPINISTGLIHVWDRLWQNGSLVNPTSYSITQPNLTRYTDGNGLSLWFREYAQTKSVTIAPVGLNISISYINNNDQSKKVTFLSEGNNGIYGIYDAFCLPLTRDCNGIKKLTGATVDWAAAPIASITYGFFIAKYYGAFPFVVQNGYPVSNSLVNTLQKINNDACLTFGIQMPGRPIDAAVGWQSSLIGTSMPSLMGNINIVEA